jgi:PAS domain S-box-containing protein
VEEELKTSSLATETSINAIFSSDLEGIITYANTSASKMWGYKCTEEMIGTNAIEYWTESTQGKAREIIESLLKEGIVATSGVLIGKRLDGTEFIVESNSVIMKGENGKPVGLIGSFSDITKRKQAEEKLKHSEYKLSEAERIGNTGSWEYDVASDTASWSENMFQIFDVDPAMPTELIFMHFVENLVHPDDREHVLTVFQDALIGKQKYDLEYRINKRDGSIVDIHALAETIRDEQGRATHMIGKVEDITEHKQAEEELAKYREHLEELVEERTKELTEKVTELEIWYDATINRELRMEELRVEMKKLKAQINTDKNTD